MMIEMHVWFRVIIMQWLGGGGVRIADWSKQSGQKKFSYMVKGDPPFPAHIQNLYKKNWLKLNAGRKWMIV